MNYIAYDIPCLPPVGEMLSAELSLLGFEGFEENENGLIAFVPENELPNEAAYLAVLSHYGLVDTEISKTAIAQRNWNADWETSFQPVAIEDKIYVRAPFHPAVKGFKFDLCIQPKMSFGTGHHHTTKLMLLQMLNMDMNCKTVFDYGCGTGILAVLAEKLGAEDILAIDSDDWASENVPENIALNSCRNISFAQGNLSLSFGEHYDIVLANINKNILLASMRQMSKILVSKGQLLMSGFYENDLGDIRESAKSAGLIYQNHKTENEWVAALFIKE